MTEINQNNDNAVVIFLGEREFNVDDKNDKTKKVPLVAFSYYDLERGEPGELTIRKENLVTYGADKITFGNENWEFKVYAVLREWERSRNYQNLKLKNVVDTGKKMELKEMPTA